MERSLATMRQRVRAPYWIQRVINQIRTFFGYMSAREKLTAGILTFVLLLSAGFSVSGYVARNSHLVPQNGGTYTEGVVGQPRYINPVLAGGGAIDVDADITSLVYSSMFKLDNNMQIVPDVATGYRISEDNLTYTISLRDDITWHDGERLTADDVVFTIRSIQTPDYDSPLESWFQGVDVEEVDEHTVRFRLKQPYVPFLAHLTVGIVPKHVWESIPPGSAALAEQIRKPIGSGPFQFSEIVKRRKTGEITDFALVRNEHYYGQHPYLDKIVFRFYPTNDEAIDALMAGQVSGVRHLPLTSANDIDARASLAIHRLTLPQYDALFFNEIKNSALSNAGVRAGLALAINREQIVEEALEGKAKVLNIPIPSSSYDFSEDIDPPTYDPATARQNLEEAGWKDENNDGIREKDGKPLAVTITTTDSAKFIETAEMIKQQWKEIGVDATVESYSAGVINQTVVTPRDYEILLYGEILSAVVDPYPFWHSTQTRSPGLNLSLFKDETIDKLLEEARKEHDPAKRKAQYLEFLKRFLDLHPAVILYQPFYLYAYDDDVRGQAVGQTSLPSGRLNDIENWHVNVKRVWNRN